MNWIDQADRIKGRLRAATTIPEIETIASQERETVRQMAKDPTEGKALAAQVANLKAYRIGQIEKGKG